MRYAHNPWGHNVSCTIFWSRDQRSRSHRSFEVFVVSTPRFPPYLTGSLHIWHITTHEGKMCHAPFSGWKVKGQGHMDVSKFLPCPLCSSVPISPIHFIWETHTTHEVVMCRAPFPGQNVIVQGHAGHLKFLLSPPCVFLLIWPDVLCTIFIYPLCGYIPIWLAFGGWGLLQL